MRITLATAALAAATLAVTLAVSATAAAAAPAAVSVTLGPKLQAKAEKTYGVREIDHLAADLRDTVQHQLARTAAYDDARVELVLTDVQPNRPTFKQLGDTVGLSMRSFGVGGAAIAGRVVRSDGSVTPVSYRWYETDIRRTVGYDTWHDASWTFDSFARRLARGEQVAQR